MDKLLYSKKLQKFPELVHAYTTAELGNLSASYDDNSTVVKRRLELAYLLNIDPKSVYRMRTTDNKGNILEITKDNNTSNFLDSNHELLCDALVTNKTDKYLFLLVGDCYPTIYYDPVKKALAVVHLSKVATNLFLAKNMISFMRRTYSSNVTDIQIFIGPGIKSTNYIYDIHPFPNDPNWKNFITQDSLGFHIDVLGYVLQQIYSMGVAENNVEVSDVDTFEDSRFFSHVRSLNKGDKDGRFGIIAGLKI